MAGTIIADRVQLDTFTDTFKIVSNTGVEVVTANSSGILTGIIDGSITSAKLANNLTVNASSIISSSNVDFKVGTSQNTAFRIEDTGQLYNSIESTQGTDYRGALYAGYMCRAWVNFNGTGTPAIRASGNVSSVADGGTGNFSIYFSTAMPDANYCAVTGTGPAAGTGNKQPDMTINSQSTSLVNIITTGAGTFSYTDNVLNYIAIFR